MDRRRFIVSSAALGILSFMPQFTLPAKNGFLQTVTGKIDLDNAGLILEHEHVLVDFIGAEKITPGRYNQNEAFNKILPYLQEVRKLGFSTFVECTPQFLGRDVILLKRLSEATGLNIITNTGLYGTQNGKYLPAYAFKETAEQLARRWISEWEKGIDGTGIKPGFIKISVDSAPIKNYQRNLVKAAAITHLATGLTISSHTGASEAALEQLEILKENKIHPSAFIWVHAQNEKTPEKHIAVVSQGAWASYDGAAWEAPERYYDLIENLRKNGYLNQTLISHDAGWYKVGEPGGGEFKGFGTISQQLLPLLKSKGYNDADIEKLLKTNPAQALEVKVRKLNS